jgi:hypothetical protein
MALPLLVDLGSVEVIFHDSPIRLCGRPVILDPTDFFGQPFASAVMCPISAAAVDCYFRNPPAFAR